MRCMEEEKMTEFRTVRRNGRKRAVRDMPMTIPEVALVAEPEEGKKNLWNMLSMAGRLRPSLVKIHNPIMRTMMAMAASVILPVPIAITPSLGL